MGIFDLFSKKKSSYDEISRPVQNEMIIKVFNRPIETKGCARLTNAEILTKVETNAPYLVDLTKKCLVELEKKKLDNVVASVVLVLDASGSMCNQYNKNNQCEFSDVQKVINRIVPLALKFDDDQTLDTLAFALKTAILTPITLSNIKNYTTQEWGGWQKWMNNLNSAYNNEPVTMQYIMENYKNSDCPTYVIFISDGGITKSQEIEVLLRESSKMPIFWQFVGVGGSNYGILSKFDNLTGMYIDNCNFFSVDKIDSISDEALYDLLLNEFPSWLKLAQNKGILK